MSSIGSPGRVFGPHPLRQEQEQRDHGDPRRGEDDLADSGAGGHFGDGNEGGFSGGEDRRAGGRPGDSATPHEQGSAPTGDDRAEQAELARQSAGFRRRLDAAMQHVAGREDRREAGSPLRLEAGDAGRSGMSAFAQLFAPPGGDWWEDARVGEDKDAARELVLAASNPAAASTLPLFPALQQAQEPAPGLHGRTLASAIEERVTQAIRAELAAQSGTTGAITINLAGLVEGLDAITISLSATGLDVVLSGNLDLASEAQSLADRLSRRFSNRSVRILLAGATTGGRAAETADGESGDEGGTPVSRRTGDGA